MAESWRDKINSDQILHTPAKANNMILKLLDYNLIENDDIDKIRKNADPLFFRKGYLISDFVTSYYNGVFNVGNPRSRYMYICNSSGRKGCYTRLILKKSFTGLNSEYSFS